MMRKLVLGFCLIFSLFSEDCWGMKKSNSDSDILSKRSSAQATAERRFSEPVTDQEKAHAIEITSMKQFRELTSAQAKELRSVTFSGMEINEEFVDKFWDLFYEGMDELILDKCVLVGETKYSDLFLGGSHIRVLKISDCGLSNDDAIAVFRNIYPWLLISIEFYGRELVPAYITSELKKSTALSPDGILFVAASSA